MIALMQQRKYLVLALLKQMQDLHYNGNESYLYINKTEICEFETKDNKSCYNFCLGSISKDLKKR